MAVELQRLMEKVSHMDVNLIAGKGGIHNLVTWVHMVETTEASDFLRKWTSARSACCTDCKTGFSRR